MNDIAFLKITFVNIYVSALLIFKHGNVVICRSPVHPSVFATASSNGSLGLWNLATSLDEPITGPHGLLLDKNDANPELPSHGVNKIKWSLDGRRIAAARSDTVHVLGLTEELWKPKGNEGAKVMNSLRSRGLIDGED